jgi:hypothetical protein
MVGTRRKAPQLRSQLIRILGYSLSNSTTDTNAINPRKDAEACTRDAALMAQVGINTIYIMTIDLKANHDDCFSIFSLVGIYIMVVLRKDGVFATSAEDFTQSYTTDFVKGMFETIDAVKDYDNLLGFDLGVFPTYSDFWYNMTTTTYVNTMKMYRVRLTMPSNVSATTNTPQAFVRDTKDYISHHAARPILVGTTYANDPSRSDYVYFYNLGFFETYPVEKQNASYLSYHQKV